MKNVAKNEIVLQDPYSNALCPLPSFWNSSKNSSVLLSSSVPYGVGNFEMLSCSLCFCIIAKCGIRSAASLLWRRTCADDKNANCTLQNFALDVLFNIEPEQKTDLIYLILPRTLSPRKQKILLQGFVIKREARKWWQKVHCICKSTSLRGILDNSVIAIVRLILCRQLEWSYQRNNLQMILSELSTIHSHLSITHLSTISRRKNQKFNLSAILLCPPGAASPSIPIQLFKSGSTVSRVFSAALNPTRGNGCEVASWRAPLNTGLEHNNCPKQQLHKERTKKNSIN